MNKSTRMIRSGTGASPLADPRRARQAGFGLIDSMISIVVISVSTVGFLSASVTSMSLEKENRTVAAANEMSRAVVEEMLALPIEQVLPTYNANKADDPAGAGTARGATWTMDTTAVLVAAVDDLADTSALRIDNSGSGSLSSGSGSSGSGRLGSLVGGVVGGVVGTTTTVVQQVVGTTSTSIARVADAEALEVPKTMDCSIGLPTSLDAAGNEVLREDTNAPEFGLPCDLNGDGVIDNKNHAADYKILPLVIRLGWPTTDGGTRSMTFSTVIGGGKAQ